MTWQSGGDDRQDRCHPHRRRLRTVPVLRRRRADRALQPARPDVEIIAYRYGYQGLLTGDSIDGDARRPAARRRLLHRSAAPPSATRRVKLTNAADCVKRGLVAEGRDPLQAAADRLTADGVDVLHTIGGDDTNTTAADLAAYLREQRIRPHRGRAAQDHRQRRDPDPAVARRLDRRRAGRALRPEHHRRAQLRPADADRARGHGPQLRLADGGDGPGLPQVARRQAQFAGDRPENSAAWDVHGVYVPEAPFDLQAEAERLGGDGRVGSVNLFISEGAGVGEIVAEMERVRRGGPARPLRPRPARQDQPGPVVRQAVRRELGAEKVLVQKSGYFSRSAAANAADLALIRRCTDYAVDARCGASRAWSAQDEERGGELRAIEFERIEGGKAFDTSAPWFTGLLREIGQA